MKYREIYQSRKIIFEGGNVFKSSSGTALTTRIMLKDIVPTIKWLERVIQMPLLANTLGSVGHKASSGDLDIGVDSRYKQQVYDALVAWVSAHGHNVQDYIRKSGISIHFKTPILGNAENGYVQTDFMFADNLDWLKFVAYGPGDSSQFTGSDRYIAMSSIAKYHGLKLSQTHGLVSRTSNRVITKDPDQVAQMLLGPNSAMADLNSVETIISALKRNHIMGDELRNQLEEFINNLSNIQFNQTLADIAVSLMD